MLHPERCVAAWMESTPIEDTVRIRSNCRTITPTNDVNAVEIYDSGLNMTAAPGMRELAHRLLTYEAGLSKTSETMESPATRVYEKLRGSLGEFVGAAGFQSLATRALTLARTGTPSLNAVSITRDGSLQGLGGIESQYVNENDLAVEGGVVLIARLLGLLRLFLGEALTLSLLRNAWPGEALGDRDQRTGEQREH
jgi:hypothetical protein